MSQPTIHTIGHSRRSLQEFVALLAEHGVRLLVDVRAQPGSRRFPHFNPGTLAPALADAGIAYEHAPSLGGHRAPAPDSPSTGWKIDAFRGFADYMRTAEFASALDLLQALAAEHPTAIMCAEAAWRDCHRGLISDALKASGWAVLHIIREGEKAEEHPYTRPARVVEGKLSYSETKTEDGLFGP